MQKIFFLDSNLHRLLKIIKSEDIAVCWNYPEEERLWLSLSYVNKNYEQAFSIKDAAGLLKINHLLMKQYIERRLLEYPSGFSYNITSKAPSRKYYSETEVFDMRDKLYELIPKNKYGEPEIRYNLPSRAELTAKMRSDSATYMKDTNGNFVKVWLA